MVDGALASTIIAWILSGISHFMAFRLVKWASILSRAGLGSDPLGITVSMAPLNSEKALVIPGVPYFSFRRPHNS
jgi:hypothetical protein